MATDPRSRRRVEDARFLTGQGRYTDDLDAPGALHAIVLRSPHAHAALRRVDAAASRAMPGVRLVLTGAEVADLAPLPCPVAIATDGPLIVPPRAVLPVDRVRHVGEAVAFVVADTMAQARDAAEAIAVDYEVLPAVIGIAAAVAPDAPTLWPQAPGNIAFRFRHGDRTATDAAFAAAAHVVALDVVNQRVHAAALEPRAAIGRFVDGRYDLACAGQSVHNIRDQLATVLAVAPDVVRVHCPDVGGGFGLKNFLFPEHALLLVAARMLGAPVRWLADPGDEFLAAVHARAMDARARLALDAEGRFLAIDVDAVADLGAYCSGAGPAVPTNSFSTAVGGPYAIPAIHLAVRGVFSNTCPVDAYRGAGKPEANYLTERLIDAAARALGADPVALRARNLPSAFPYRAATGQVFDSGRTISSLHEAVAAIDRAGFAARRAASAAAGLRRGLGIACFLETARGAPDEWAALRMDGDGRVTLRIGTQSNGQGHETSFPQVVGAMLGVPEASVALVQADTEKIPRGGGHGGARSLHLGSGAMDGAAAALLAKARGIAAQLLQAAPDDLDFADGAFTVRGTARLVTLPAVAAEVGGLDGEHLNRCDLRTYPGGCHIAEVEVDPETGAVTLARYLAVDDYGTLVNPMLTIGQVQGGVAQGIGQALCEAITYDPESGQLLSASLMDYTLPRAGDLPDLEITLAEDAPSNANPLGAKGSGQAGAIAAPQAVMLAVIDALDGAPLEMPATPEIVWRAATALRGSR